MVTTLEKNMEKKHLMDEMAEKYLLLQAQT